MPCPLFRLMTMKKLTNEQTSFRIKQLLRNYKTSHEKGYIYLAHVDDNIDISFSGQVQSIGHLLLMYATISRGQCESLLVTAAAILDSQIGRTDLAEEIIKAFDESDFNGKL